MENRSLSSAIRLYNYIFDSFWNGDAIVGPDPGINFELRLFRFIKSYLAFINWPDNYYFLQTQGYWIKSNWDLFEITGDVNYKKVAIACSNYVINRQRKNGSWEYPLKSWKKYVSTVEGTWASLGVLETFKWTKEPKYLEGALKWYDFLINKTGFQRYKDSMAINYFDVPSVWWRLRVPNNTTLVLWFLSELYRIRNDLRLPELNGKMIRFIQLAQNNSGELKYAIERDHYFCYQYNAFEFLDLSHSYKIINDERIRIILEKLAKFLSTGVTEIGSIKYDCFQTFPEVIHSSGAVGAALATATFMGLSNYDKHIEYTYNFLFERQRQDGSFPNSAHTGPRIRKPISHGFLADNRSYPRQLSYILQHLLIKARLETNLGADH